MKSVEVSSEEDGDGCVVYETISETIQISLTSAQLAEAFDSMSHASKVEFFTKLIRCSSIDIAVTALAKAARGSARIAEMMIKEAQRAV